MVVLMGSGSEETPLCVELTPYAHQVGGHVGVLALDSHTICKPHIDQEYQFYQDLPSHLYEFVPQFKGTAEVVVHQARDGYLNLVACPYRSQQGLPTEGDVHMETDKENPQYHHHMSLTCQPRLQITKPIYRVRLSEGGSLFIDQDSDSDDLFEDMSVESGCRRFGCNPWSMYCHRQQIAKMREEQGADQSHKFLLLENVTDEFRHPCILDLKIGFRSYGDAASEAKKRSHIAKVQGTTSGRLGIRVCGMQVYRPDKGRFICRNKYYGRRLSDEGLQQAVAEFVFDGREYRLDVIAALMDEIRKLNEALSKLDHYRFYGSSLLLIYEGEPDRSHEQCELGCQSVAAKSERNLSHHRRKECCVDITLAKSEDGDICCRGGIVNLKNLGLKEGLGSSDAVMASELDSDSLACCSISGMETNKHKAENQRQEPSNSGRDTLQSSPSATGRDVKRQYESLNESDSGSLACCSAFRMASAGPVAGDIREGHSTVREGSSHKAPSTVGHRVRHLCGSSNQPDKRGMTQKHQRTGLQSSPTNIPDSEDHSKRAKQTVRSSTSVPGCRNGPPLVHIKMIDFANAQFRELSATRKADSGSQDVLDAAYTKPLQSKECNQPVTAHSKSHSPYDKGCNISAETHVQAHSPKGGECHASYTNRPSAHPFHNEGFEVADQAHTLTNCSPGWPPENCNGLGMSGTAKEVPLMGPCSGPDTTRTSDPIHKGGGYCSSDVTHPQSYFPQGVGECSDSDTDLIRGHIQDHRGHAGPDTDFLYGLENLLSIFKDIHNKNACDQHMNLCSDNLDTED